MVGGRAHAQRGSIWAGTTMPRKPSVFICVHLWFQSLSIASLSIACFDLVFLNDVAQALDLGLQEAVELLGHAADDIHALDGELLRDSRIFESLRTLLVLAAHIARGR